MKEKHPKMGEGDPKGDWQKEFADQYNPDVALVAAKLEAVPCIPEGGKDPGEKTK